MTMRFNPALIPPSIRDARGLAFGETARQALAEPDFKLTLYEWIDDAPAVALPFLIREFGLHKFIEPGLPDATIRAMLKASFELHKEIGYIRGVRFGLGLLGIRITAWQQWFQATPPAAPGTHRVSVALDGPVYPGDGMAITPRLQRQITRMVRHTQRASQSIAVDIAAPPAPVVMRFGLGIATRITMRMRATPRETMNDSAPVYTGMGMATRITCRMVT